jgi:PAS domain S-box-containing protein
MEVFADESQQRLVKSEERFRLLLDQAEDVAIFFVTSSGIVAEWSHGAELCTGWLGAEIVGRDFSVLFVPGDAASRLPAELLAAAREGRRGFSDRWLVRKDGTRFWARFSLVALHGQPDAGFGILLRDVSAEKDAERRLQIKAEVLDCMSESVCVVDDALRIIYANPAANRTFGYNAGEMIGFDVRLLNGFDPEENDRRLASLMAHFDHSRHWAGEWQNRRKDGTVFATHTRLSVFHHQGARYFICVQEDLTTRKQAEAAVQRSAQLQEIVGELEAFSYSISHDLKSPLRSVHGFADAVIQDYGDALQGAGMHYMQRIRQAAERLEKMVEDILTVSRLPREALPLAAVDVGRLIASILEESPHLRAPQAQVAIAGMLPVVLGHEPSLRQVFLNLLGNAVKFMPAARTPVVTIWAEIGVAEATIWVEDNGVGIAPADQERIFRAFERVDREHAFPGTGVGLAIVKRSVERLGGSVGVRSQVGSGSRFWVKLRLARGGG